MKKVYFLCLLLWMSFAANAQTTVIIYAGGSPGGGLTPYAGTFTTGSALNAPPSATYTTADNTIAVANSTTSKQAGYATFKLDSIPAGAAVSKVILGVNRFGYTAGTPFGTCYTVGHTVNLTTAGLTPANLYTACTTTGSGGTLLWSASVVTNNGSYGMNVGDTTMISTVAPSVSPAACTFIQANAGIGHTVSISFANTVSNTNVYNFTGENGVTDTAGLHAPYLMVTYCYNPIGVTTTASPSTLCVGATLTLTGTASGASSYTWNGPGGFTGTALDTSFVVTPGSAGIYTLTANTLCGTFTRSVTGTVTVSPSPAAMITTTTTVCQGNVIAMSDVTVGGVWTSSNTNIATVDATGHVTGVNSGINSISYTLGVCPAIAIDTVNDPPTAVTGPSAVCASGGSITLLDGVTGGTWTSSVPADATIDPATGVVTGVVTGATTITYVTGACPSVNYAVTVDPLPTGILGGAVLCANTTLPLSDATAGGTWSSSNSSLATVDPNTGIVSGAASGAVTITYTLPTGCYITAPITVNSIPATITGPSEVCIGLTINLSDGTTGGTWSSSSNPTATVVLATGVVTGVSANPVTITYTLPVTGCYNTHPVTVNPLPNPITGLTAVCAGSVITLSDATASGTWSSQTPAVATADPATGDVTGVAAGNVNISYTLIATGCYKTYPVTVNPLPVDVITPAGPTTFCAGGSVLLNATVVGGDTYQWFSNGNPNGNTTASYTSITTELVTVQITDVNGCVNLSAGTQVTLIPSVAIIAGGPTTFCFTGNVLLTVPLAPSILYQWYLNGTAITGANANTYAATLNGTYTCALTVPGGCSSTTPTFVVTVHPLPVPTVTYIGNNELVTTNNYLTYDWFLNGIGIPGATTDTVSTAANGTYTVRVVDGNGCVGYSVGYVVNTLGVSLINKADIKIYPNPASTNVHIESPVTVNARITGIEGKLLMDVNNAKDIDISALPDGIYMMMVYDQSGNRLVVQKLIKE